MTPEEKRLKHRERNKSNYYSWKRKCEEFSQIIKMGYPVDLRELPKRFRRRSDLSESDVQAKREYYRSYLSKNREKSVIWQREYRSKFPERNLEYGRRWRKKNPEKAREVYRRSARKNRKAINQRAAKKVRENLAYACFNASMRRACKKKKTPKGVNKKLISVFYQIANRLTKCVGIKFHVDHFLPLEGDGNHEPCNLWVIPGSVNLWKSDRQFPSKLQMWEEWKKEWTARTLIQPP